MPVRKGTLIVVTLAGLLTLATLSIRSGAQIAAPADVACANVRLKGAYGYANRGMIMGMGGGMGCLAESGLLTADGMGNLSGADTQVLGEQIVQRTYTGSYTVNANCTGSATLNDSLRKTTHLNFVIVDNGKEVKFIRTDPGAAFAGSWTRQ